MKNRYPKPRANLPVIILSIIGMLLFYISFIGNFTPFGLYIKSPFTWITTITAAVLAPILLLYVVLIYKFMSTRVGLIVRYFYAVAAGLVTTSLSVISVIQMLGSAPAASVMSSVLWKIPNLLLFALYVVILVLLFRGGQIRPFVVIAFIILLFLEIVSVISFSITIPDLARQIEGVPSMGFWDIMLTYIGYAGSFFALISRFVFVMANAPNRKKPEKKEIDKDSPITSYTIT